MIITRDLSNLIAALDEFGAPRLRLASGCIINTRNGPNDTILLSSKETKNRQFRIENHMLDIKDCSGIIFEETNVGHVPIAVPPRLSFEVQNVKPSTHNYDLLISPLYDCTTFTLYYHGKWHMSTANSTDITEFVPSYTTKTFKKLLEECCGKLWEDITEPLDKAYCYNAIFQHPELHQSITDARAITICRTNLLSLEEDYGPCEELCFDCNECKVVSSVDIKDVVETMDQHYSLGIVIRSNDISLRIETRRMKRIRYYWYNPKRFRSTDANKKLMVFISAFTTNNEKEFIELFPRYEKEIKQIEEFISSTAIAICNGSQTVGHQKTLQDTFNRIKPFEPKIAAVKHWLLSDEAIDIVLLAF